MKRHRAFLTEERERGKTVPYVVVVGRVVGHQPPLQERGGGEGREGTGEVGWVVGGVGSAIFNTGQSGGET